MWPHQFLLKANWLKTYYGTTHYFVGLFFHLETNLTRTSLAFYVPLFLSLGNL
jgi:hypothetical protein